MPEIFSVISTESDIIETTSYDESLTVKTYETGASSEDSLMDFNGFTSSTSQLDENLINRRRLNQFKERHTNELIQIILEQDFEYGFDSLADLFIRKLMSQNRTVTKEWLNTVFIDHFDNSRILTGLLQIISHMDYFDIYPEGPTMAVAALTHVDSEVREGGIRAFENWGTLDSLKVLNNIHFKEQWLQEYVEQVTSDLEEEF